MKKSKDYVQELVPVFLCFGSIEALPSLELIISKTVLEAQQDLLKYVKTLVDNQELINVLDAIHLE